MIIYTCPECGHDLIIEAVTCIPPINKYYCPSCGWSHMTEEEAVRIPFGGNSLAMKSLVMIEATEEEAKSVNEYVDRISSPTRINFYDNFNVTSACDGCTNNPKNGGSGICNCILGQIQWK